MPKVLQYTPEWLTRGSPGFNLFTRSPQAPVKPSQGSQALVPSRRPPFKSIRRVIARRGTEIFVATGTTLKWGDLASFKDDWELTEALDSTPTKGRGKNGKHISFDDETLEGAKYKTLKVNVGEDIQQLIPSPNNEFLAIVTDCTIQIAILPDPSHLSQPDSGPIRIKTNTLGPTTHVRSQSRIVEAIWHPLGVSGQCLVTVTADAAVRLWELNKDTRWSYEQPTVHVDLTKLLHAETADDDTAPARIGESKGFSPDNIGMEVAAASFGGTGSEDEQGWSSMTLWVAMTEGDVFALCPLLPSKWQSPSTQIPSLTTSVVAKRAYAEGPDSHEELHRNFKAQYKWLTEIDEQEPMPVDASDAENNGVFVYNRPRSVGHIPRLQGPFRILPSDLQEELDLADLHVVAPKLRIDDLVGAEDDDSFDEPDPDGLSATIVCLATVGGRVFFCLNMEEVEGQWLPLKKPRSKPKYDPDNQPELVVLEALDTLRVSEVETNEHPAFTPDVHSRYAFFVTHSKGVFYFSLQPLIEPIESELSHGDLEGSKFRMKTIRNGPRTLRERVMNFNDATAQSVLDCPTAAVVFHDSVLGYFIITIFNGVPKAITLDSPEDAFAADVWDLDLEPDFDSLPKELPPPQEPYEPASIFWDHKTALHSLLATHANKRHSSILKDEVKLSPATLDVMTEAHRVLSSETNILGTAVAELFRRCERLQQELSNQVKSVAGIANRVDGLLGDDFDDHNEMPTIRGTDKLEERLETARQRQETLTSRHEALRKKLASVSARPLSKAEHTWSAEVNKLQSSLDKDAETKPPGKIKPEWLRVEQVRELADKLSAEAREAAKGGSNEAETDRKGDPFKVPPDLRKNKMNEMKALLDRETALVDAVTERLDRLGFVGSS